MRLLLFGAAGDPSRTAGAPGVDGVASAVPRVQIQFNQEPVEKVWEAKDENPSAVKRSSPQPNGL